MAVAARVAARLNVSVFIAHSFCPAENYRKPFCAGSINIPAAIAHFHFPATRWNATMNILSWAEIRGAGGGFSTGLVRKIARALASGNRAFERAETQTFYNDFFSSVRHFAPSRGRV
jgi:hypothetical protein